MKHRLAVIQALEALGIDSASSYTWLGQRSEVRRPANGGANDESLLARALEARLYDDFYCTGGVAPPVEPYPEPSGPWPTPTVEAFSSANGGRGSRQGGWTVVGVDDGAVVVERDGLRLWADASQALCDEGGEPGDPAVLMLPKESFGLSRGFYTAHGDAGSVATSDGTPLDRSYWNVRPEGRAHLVGALTAALNRAGLPFRFKVLNDPAVVRCDAGVLYTARAQRGQAARIVADVLSSAAPALRASTPVFTKRLAPGLAFAEDPGGDESFGEHRCRLLAEAVVEAERLGRQALDDRLAVVERRFARDGLSLAAAHLNAGSDARDDPVLAA